MKKVFAILMCLVMVMTFMPAMAWADEGGIAPQEDVTYQENTLYCIKSWGAACDENGILTVTDSNAVSSTLNLELNWNQELYFAKLNEDGELQAVDISTDTSESQIELFVEKVMDYETNPDGEAIPYCYKVWANKTGKDTIHEVVDNVLTIDVQSDLPVFGMYYSKDISVDNFIFFNNGFSYLLSGDDLEGDKTFYVALNKDAEQNIEGLEFRITDNDKKPITTGITVGTRDDSNAQYYIWPISVSDQFRSAENNCVNISLNRGEDEIYCDFNHIYDSQTIPEANQLVWVDMSDGKIINEGYVSTADGNDFNSNFMLTGKVGEIISNICFGYREEQEDGRVFIKVIYPQAGSYDLFSVSEREDKPGFYNVTLKKGGKTVYEVEDTDSNTSYLMFLNATKPSPAGGGGGGGGGGAAPAVQKPTIETAEGVKVTLSTDGATATITVEEGYEITDVTVNGISKGAVSTVSGLKTGDTLAVTAARKAGYLTAEEQKKVDTITGFKPASKSKQVKLKNGKKAIRITWNTSEYQFDGVEIWRSMKKNSGYGKKPMKTIKSKSTKYYYNTTIKKGKTYYYKLRGYVEVNGQKYYTPFSNKVQKTVK